MDRLLVISVRDRSGAPLPGSKIVFEIDGEPIAKVVDSEGRAIIQIAGPPRPVTVTVSYPGQETQSGVIAPDQQSRTFEFPVVGAFAPATLWARLFQSGVAIVAIVVLLGVILYFGRAFGLLPPIVGFVLLLVALGLAFAFREPSPLQAQLVRSTFALGAGGLATQIPGLLSLQLDLVGKAVITASGAIAVYVITFFFVPATQRNRPEF